MVSRIVKSSRKWSLAVFAVLVAGAVYLTLDNKPEPAKAQGGGGTPTLATIPNPPAVTGGSIVTPTKAFSMAGPTAPQRCMNRGCAPSCATASALGSPSGSYGTPAGSGGGGCGTGKCGGSTSPAPTAHGVPAGLISGGGSFVPSTTTGSTMGTSTAISALGRAGGHPAMTSTGNSIIDSQTLNYIHYAWDWPASNGLRIERIHRYRDMDRQSSFGPGVFSNFDAQLRLFDVGSSGNPLPVVEVFDPLANSTRRMMPATASDQSRFVDNNSVSNSHQYKTSPLVHDDALKSHAYRELRLLDSSGQPAATDYTQAVSAELVLHSGDVFHFEIIQAGSEFIDIDTGEAFLQPRDGRLVSIRDHTNRGMTISYKSWTEAELQESPERQWQIDTVTDAHGVSAQFHYGQTQVATRWAVSQIDLPNGESVSYTYENDQITAVNHPDGSQSTFAYGWESVSQTTSLTFFDPSAEGSHRTKQVYLSNNLVDVDGFVYTSSSNLVRVVVNGDGEVTYMNMQTGPSNQMYVYGGAGKMFYPSGGNHWTDGWDIDEPSPEIPLVWGGNLPQTNLDDTSNRLEPNGTTWGYPGDSLSYSVGAPAYIYNEHGTSTQYAYTSSNAALASVTHPDGSTESYTRDSEDRVTMYTDRLGRSRQFTYDDRGNLTKLDLFKWSAADDFYEDYWDGDDTYGDYGQEDYTENNIQATWNWEYFPAGHVNEFMLAAFIDANGNRTDYEYDSNHRISKVIEPPDFEGDPRATTDYTWDNIGRLTVISDPSGSVRQFEYDNRNRLIKTTYSDGTSERKFYGTGANANLVVRSKDRRGVLTDYEYDATGRVTKTILAAGNMDESGSEFPLSSPTVTVENTVEYLNGTDLPVTTVSAGSRTDYTYDYKHRMVAKSVYPNTETTLTTHNVYVDNRKLYEQDAYGRRKYFGYDNSSGRMIRTIQATVPEFVPDGNNAYFDGDAFAATYLGDGTTFQQLLDYLEQDGGVTGEEGYGMYFGINDIIMSHVRKPDPDVNGHAIITDAVYNQDGQALERINGRGFSTQYQFDAGRNITAEVMASGTAIEARTERDYDAQGNVLFIRTPRYFDPDDAQGFEKSQTALTYTGRNLLATREVATNTPEAATESFTYDLSRQQSSHTDYRGALHQTLRTSCCNRTVLSINPAGNGVVTHRDALGNITHQVSVADAELHTDLHDPLNGSTLRETTNRYDELGRITASTTWLTPLGVVDTDSPVIYDGAPINSTAQAPAQGIYGLTTHWSYTYSLDDDSAINNQLNELAADSLIALNLDGSASKKVSPSGISTIDITDSTGRTVAKVTLESNGEIVESVSNVHDTIVSLPSYGEVVESSRVDALGNVLRHRRNALGKIVEVVDASGNIGTVQYDPNGNRVATNDPNGVGYILVYDELDRAISATDALGHAQHTRHDREGNTISITDPKGNQRVITLNVRGRATSMIDRLGGNSTSAYDAMGNRISVTDADGATTEYEYDNTGQRIAILSPGHETGSQPGDPTYRRVQIQYTASGDVSSNLSAAGLETRYNYDLAGRVIERIIETNDNESDTHQFDYNADSKMISATTAAYANVTTFKYDGSGRLIEETLHTDATQFQTATTFDSAGRPVAFTFPNGSTDVRAYSQTGGLLSVQYDGSPIVTRQYDNGGRVSHAIYGNGIHTDYTYFADNRPNTIASTAVGNYAYDYDANKNRTGETITGGSSGYGYVATIDNKDRLTNWSRNNGSSNISWNLSLEGDALSRTESGNTEMRGYSQSHAVESSGNTLYQSDVDGRRIEGDGRIYQWGLSKSVDRIISDSSDTTFSYDAFGRRIAVTSDGNTSMLIWSKDRLVGVYAPDGSLKQNRITGIHINEVYALAQTDEITYCHSDPQFNVRAFSNSAGAVVEYCNYSPYGSISLLSSAGVPIEEISTPWAPTFMSQLSQEVDGLSLFRHRVYDSQSERFLRPDPVGYEDGLNRYAFVGNNPLRFREVNGLKKEEGVEIDAGFGHSIYVVEAKFQDLEVDCCWKGGIVKGKKMSFSLEAAIVLGLYYKVHVPLGIGMIPILIDFGGGFELGRLNVKLKDECSSCPAWNRECCCDCASVGIAFGPRAEIDYIIGRAWFAAYGQVDGRICFSNGRGCKKNGFAIGICASGTAEAGYRNFWMVNRWFETIDECWGTDPDILECNKL